MSDPAMPTVDAALDAMLAALSPLAPVERPLADCGGAVLAEPLVAQWTQPPFAASAMDGYAVRSADLAAGSEALRLVGEAAAGHAFDRPVGPGEAVRISTGAPVPDGADQVVMQEKASPDGKHPAGRYGLFLRRSSYRGRATPVAGGCRTCGRGACCNPSYSPATPRGDPGDG